MNKREMKMYFKYIMLLLCFLLFMWLICEYENIRNRMVLKDMERFYIDASAYAEELVPLAKENLALLDSLKSTACSLPYESILTDGRYAHLDGDTSLADLSNTDPGLFQLLDQLQNNGLKWEVMYISKEREHIGILMLTEVAGGTEYSIFITSPPIKDSTPNYKAGFIELSDSWGISWSVNTMSGM